MRIFICLCQILAPNIFFFVLRSLTIVRAFQATAEQMRLAQVIFDKNDSEFEAKVKQVCFWQRILSF